MLKRLLVGGSAHAAQGFNGNVQAQTALPEHKLVQVLLARCSLDPNLTLSRQLHELPLYKLQLTASAWERVLDELIASGLLGKDNDFNGFTCTLSQLDARLMQIQIHDPAKLRRRAQPLAPGARAAAGPTCAAGWATACA